VVVCAIGECWIFVVIMVGDLELCFCELVIYWLFEGFGAGMVNACCSTFRRWISVGFCCRLGGKCLFFRGDTSTQY